MEDGWTRAFHSLHRTGCRYCRPNVKETLPLLSVIDSRTSGTKLLLLLW